MSYDELIETISQIVENEKIKKNGLSLIYELNETDHLNLNMQIQQRVQPYSNKLVQSDEFEVILGGLSIKFVKLKNS